MASEIIFNAKHFLEVIFKNLRLIMDQQNYQAFKSSFCQGIKNQ